MSFINIVISATTIILGWIIVSALLAWVPRTFDPDGWIIGAVEWAYTPFHYDVFTLREKLFDHDLKPTIIYRYPLFWRLSGLPFLATGAGICIICGFLFVLGVGIMVGCTFIVDTIKNMLNDPRRRENLFFRLLLEKYSPLYLLLFVISFFGTVYEIQQVIFELTTHPKGHHSWVFYVSAPILLMIVFVWLQGEAAAEYEEQAFKNEQANLNSPGLLRRKGK